jgi:hypothetical protein
MKESIIELVKECIDCVDVASLLKDLEVHIQSKSTNKIKFNYYDDFWEFADELNDLSLEDLKEFVNLLEDEFVVYLLTLPQSFKFKLYSELMMEPGT